MSDKLSCDLCGKQASPGAYERNKQWLCYACWVADLNQPPNNMQATISRLEGELAEANRQVALDSIVFDAVRNENATLRKELAEARNRLSRVCEDQFSM